jgi:hypothetical protein
MVIVEVHGLVITWVTGCNDQGFFMFFSVTPGKCKDKPLK